MNSRPQPKRTLTAQLNALRTTALCLFAVSMILLCAFVFMLTSMGKVGGSSDETTATSETTTVPTTAETSATEETTTESTTEATTTGAHASYPADTKIIALTFDDGPDKCTPQVLDALERNGVVATFFMIGQNVSGTDASVLKRMVDLKCEIGNHTWAHKTLTKLSVDEAYEQLQKCDQAIMDKIGQKATVIRPPEGAGLMQDGLFKYSFENKEYVVNWDDVCCPKDWAKPALGDAHYTAQYVIDNASDGSMVLLHDSHQSTADSLDEMIQGLKDKGFVFVTVSEVLESRSASLGLTVEKATSKGWDSSMLMEAYPGGPVYGVRYAYVSSKLMFEERKKS